MTVRALRWFGGGKCLVADEQTHETFTVARIAPGERAEIERFEVHGRRIPVATTVLEPSPHRRAATCARYERCTGCDLLHVSEAEETRYKQLTVAEVLERHAGVSVERVEVVGGSYRGNHRARARFSVERSDQGLRLGLRDFSGELLDTTECEANTHEVRATLRAIRGLLREHRALRVRAVEVIGGLDGNAVVYELAEGDAVDGFAPLIASTRAIEGVAAVGIRRGIHALELVSGTWPRQLPIGDLQLEAAVDAWVQPTPTQATALYSWVLGLGLHRDASVLDATCGTGGLALAMAPTATSVLGVDANWNAIRSATSSAEQLGAVNVRFRGGKIETVAARLRLAGEAFEHTVVNPMRRSLGPECMADLAAMARRTLLYLAPAPRAGAADVAELVRLGLGVRRVAAVNLHPGTAQVMMAVVLAR